MNYDDICEDVEMEDDIDWDLVNDDNHPVESIGDFCASDNLIRKALSYSQATMRTTQGEGDVDTDMTPALEQFAENDIPITLFDSTAASFTATTNGIRDCVFAVGENGASHRIDFETWPGDDSEDEDVDTRHHFTPGQLIGVPVSELQSQKSKLTENRISEKNEFSTAPKHNQLLVDKYRPTKFTDLTSNETVNLKVLEWMKEWDPCVFPARKKVKKAEPGKLLQKMDKILKKEEAEKDPRPEAKIILISGPPGAGKTTLATVIASHCGYETMQINASMDRTASSIDEKINVIATGDGTLSQKPYCLILDEIDGIASSSQGVLSKLLKLTEVPWKDRHKKACQLRPVICICNDPWVKELRGLRSVADHIKIDNITTEKLAGRLKAICRQEHIQADTMALKELCGISNGDIRSCLFTLQFLSRRHKKLGINEITGSGDGIKDRVPHWTEVMQAIFGLDEATASKKLQKLPNVRYGGRKSVAYARQLLSGNPDTEKVFDACFEAYPELKYADYDMKKTRRLLRGVSERDSFSEGGSSYADLTQVLLLFHVTCQSTLLAKRTWQFPKVRMEANKKYHQSKEIIEHHIGPRRQHLSVTTFALDVLSPFLAILQPANIKVQKSFLTQDSSDELRFATLCCLYNAYNVTYKKIEKKHEFTSKRGEADSELDYFMVMVPDLRSVSFNNKYKRYRFLPTETKLRISSGVQKIKMLSQIQKEAVTVPNQDGNKQSDQSRSLLEGDSKSFILKELQSLKKAPIEPAKKEGLPAHIQNATLRKKQAVNTPTIVAKKRDMFGNVISTKDGLPLSPSNGTATKTGLQAHRMFDPKIGCKYEQNSGFTNAVKRRCTWSDWV
eukprot:TRINITY_DN22656_c0_g1_i1.p1 TRINITY_DN22656_c0_g1~~TRINITY_DN22656_c0_g1_i1.p1  ORF type:complete len:847 (+),score=159.86 TRINITY_DN22656_c0_g1_i1:48-2588(+)